MGIFNASNDIETNKSSFETLKESWKINPNTQLMEIAYNERLQVEFSNVIKKITQMQQEYELGHLVEGVTPTALLTEEIMYKLRDIFYVNSEGESTFEIKYPKKVVTDSSGVDYSYLFPSFDSYINDKGVVDYMNKIYNKNIKSLDGWIDVLKNRETPMKMIGFTYQTGLKNGSNFMRWRNNIGVPNQAQINGINQTGGAFVLVSTPEEIISKYGYCCEYDPNTKGIIPTNLEVFGRDVLGGVPLSDANGVYIIQYNLDVNPNNLSCPSIYNATTYAGSFVPGGQNTGGLAEAVVTAISLENNTTDAKLIPSPTDIGAYTKPITFNLNLNNVGANPNHLFYQPTDSNTDSVTIYLYKPH